MAEDKTTDENMTMFQSRVLTLLGMIAQGQSLLLMKLSGSSKIDELITVHAEEVAAHVQKLNDLIDEAPQKSPQQLQGQTEAAEQAASAEHSRT